MLTFHTPLSRSVRTFRWMLCVLRLDNICRENKKNRREAGQVFGGERKEGQACHQERGGGDSCLQGATASRVSIIGTEFVDGDG